jgi:hypothetical protein
MPPSLGSISITLPFLLLLLEHKFNKAVHKRIKLKSRATVIEIPQYGIRKI